jgi:hypothetical protein
MPAGKSRRLSMDRGMSSGDLTRAYVHVAAASRPGIHHRRPGRYLRLILPRALCGGRDRVQRFDRSAAKRFLVLTVGVGDADGSWTMRSTRPQSYISGPSSDRHKMAFCAVNRWLRFARIASLSAIRCVPEQSAERPWACGRFAARPCPCTSRRRRASLALSRCSRRLARPLRRRLR